MLPLENIYINGKIIRLFNLGPIALFSIYKLNNGDGKILKDIGHADV